MKIWMQVGMYFKRHIAELPGECFGATWVVPFFTGLSVPSLEATVRDGDMEESSGRRGQEES
jgi:hypothetical protein